MDPHQGVGILEFVAILVLGAVFGYGVLIHLPRGFTRAFCLLPLLAVFALLPLRAASTHAVLTLAFFVVWMASSKLLLLCWDAGIAQNPDAMASFPRFFVALYFPFAVPYGRTATPTRRVASAFDDAAAKKRQIAFGDGAASKENVTVPSDDGAALKQKFSVHLGEDATPLEEKVSATFGSGTAHKENMAVPFGYDATRKEKISVTFGSGAALREYGSVPFGKDSTRTEKICKPSTESAVATLRRSALKILVLLPFYRVYDFRSFYPTVVVDAMYSFHVYFAASALFEGLAAVGSLLVGFKIHKQFDRPYLAGSLSEFWGRRWNQLASSVLRASIYDPMFYLTSNSLMFFHSQTFSTSKTKHLNDKSGEEKLHESVVFKSRIIASLTVFLVSGLMHELIFFYCSGQAPGYFTAFFVLHGVATSVEAAIRRAWPGRPKIPTPLATILTVSFVFTTAVWLFFPGLTISGADLGVIQEFNDAQSWIFSRLTSFSFLKKSSIS